MDTDSQFKEFNRKVRLNLSKRDKLKSHRRTLRSRIRNYFADQDWDIPNFASQGSFPLQTNINPIKTEDDDGNTIEEYDLDDGVYFICEEDKREYAKTYHDRVFEAVDGHAKEAEKKPSCVRVIYYDGHHVDLPIYWLAEEGETPEIARSHSGYTQSDPQEFKRWVEDQISATSETGQLRRMIRHLKAWRDFQQTENETLRLPPGVTLTILACQNFHEDKRDDVSFRETLRAIKDSLDDDFSCLRPTTPSDEDLLASFSKTRILATFNRAVEAADDANETDDLAAACSHWRKVLGERFPAGETEGSTSQSGVAKSSALADERFDVSWRKAPKWPILNSHWVRLKATSTEVEHSPVKTSLQNDGPPLKKHLYLQFGAETNVVEPFHVYWQIVNTGAEAINSGQTRGQIQGAYHSGSKGLRSSDSRQIGRKERTLYSGMHWVECFIVRQNKCLARSGPFVINIK